MIAYSHGLGEVFFSRLDRRITAVAFADAIHRAPEIRGLIARSGFRVDQTVLNQLPALQWIGIPGAGYDHIDLKLTRDRKIVVASAASAVTIATAELTTALIFAATRKIFAHDEAVRKQNWNRNQLMTKQLSDQCLGILGFGRIGSAVAKRLRTTFKRVIACDPFVSAEIMKAHQVERVSFESLLNESDVLTLHPPLTQKTRGLFSAEIIGRLKPRAILINCARGELISETALIEALRSNHLQAAALDVFEVEPLALDSGLLELKNVILSPHLGARTFEAQENVESHIADLANDFFIRNQKTDEIQTYDDHD